MSGKPLSDEMFKIKFEEKFIPEPNSGCWLWIGSVIHSVNSDYGALTRFQKKLLAHRASHEIYKGPIPEGMHIDHLCRNTLCVNPDHLEAVTQVENARRAVFFRHGGDFCGKGHPRNEKNTWWDKKTGYRRCRPCHVIVQAGLRWKKVQERAIND